MVFGFFLIFIITFQSALAADLKIVLPCGKSPFPSCDSQRIRLIDGDYQNPQQPKPGFRKMTLELIDGFYEGKVDPLGVEGTNGVRQAVEKVGRPPICLATPISEHACKDEYLKNFKDQTCPPVSRVGQITPDKYFYGLGRANNGTLETALIAGGLVLGLSNQAKEIEKNILANELIIPSGSGCTSRALQFQKALADQTSVNLLELVEQGDVTGTGTGSNKKYFESGYSILQASYLFLAKCRLIEEAASKARSFSLKYVSRIEEEVLKLCQIRYPGRPDQLRACYKNNFSTWIRMRAKNEFPLLTNCTPTPQIVEIPPVVPTEGDPGMDYPEPGVSPSVAPILKNGVK